MNAYAQKERKASSEKDKTGIPRQMKAKFERSSGFSFDDVRVHYNSEKPAQLHAHAYTQGSEVFVAPGQEKHLPHELGHVVQQKSNEVKPTGEVGGMPLNDDEAMEDGADKLAEEAESSEDSDEVPLQAKAKDGGIVQMASGESAYNWTAGLVSALTGIAGTGLAFASFVYSKYNARKHKYIDEIEKYADAACDASEEYIAQKEIANNAPQGNQPPAVGEADKAKAGAEMLKLKAKAERNYKAAIEKTIAMNKYKETPQNPQQPNPQAQGQQGQVQQGQIQQGQIQQGQGQQGQNQQQQAPEPTKAERIRSGDFSSIKYQDVKFTLERAKRAVEKCQEAPAGGGGAP